jgi:hypothetical protein
MTDIMNINKNNSNEYAEKYILNRLDADEKTAYESFLEENEQARKELEETRALINGLRTVGADAMRREIERQVQEIKSPKTDWSLLYKAAAILFIFVLVPAILYFQLYEIKDDIASTEQFVPQEFNKIKETENEKEQPAKAPEANFNEKPALTVQKNQTKKARSKSPKIEISTPAANSQRKKMAMGDNITRNDDQDILEDDLGDLDYMSDLTRSASSGPALRLSKSSGTEQSSITNYMIESTPTVSHIFKHNNQSVQFQFHKDSETNTFPDSFAVKIYTHSKNIILLTCDVPLAIFTLDRKDISLKWHKENTIQLVLADSNFYEITLGDKKTQARKTTFSSK